MMLSEPSRGWDNKTCENLTCNSFTFLASITASIHSCFQVILTCLLSIFTLLWEELVASMLQHDPLDILFSFIFISWRLITLQYCSGFCHTLTWISHGVACVPHSDPPSCLPPHLISLGLPSAPALSTCLMHPTWAGDLFHPFESVVMRWMKLQPIIQSEVSQKDKDQYSILTHIYGI